MSSLLPTLAAFAAATDRIKLGTGVLLTPFHNPLRLAEDAATVDLISGGRLILGLGLAWREEEFRMFGVPMSERVRRTTETIDILRPAWPGKRFSHQGQVFAFGQVDDATLRTLTPAGPPEELVRILRPQVEAFGERKDFHLIFRLHYPGMAFETAAGAVELFGERVLPALKGT